MPARGGSRDYLPDPRLGLPFTAQCLNGPIVSIRMQAAALGSRALSEPSAYQWIAGFVGDVIVDASALASADSALCSWLVALAAAAKPSPTRVIGANGRVVQTFKLLHLDRVVTIAG
jgi:hypothetical protein